jgi:hypothetical protein
MKRRVTGIELEEDERICTRLFLKKRRVTRSEEERRLIEREGGNWK